MEIEQAGLQRAAIIELLTAENLPTVDLPEVLENFLIAKENSVLIGVAGLEIYGNYGLLRSLAVSRNYRNKGIAGKLLQQIEIMAAEKSITEIYLLTETASGYFEQKEYQKIDRAAVPAEIMKSSEFSHVCPVSAIVMKKK